VGFPEPSHEKQSFFQMPLARTREDVSESPLGMCRKVPSGVEVQNRIDSGCYSPEHVRLQKLKQARKDVREKI
jgi:hypothetical protein